MMSYVDRLLYLLALVGVVWVAIWAIRADSKRFLDKADGIFGIDDAATAKRKKKQAPYEPGKRSDA